MSDITDYTVDSELSSTSENPVQNKIIKAEFNSISDAIGELESAVNDKANASHNHDDVYYNKSEVDTKFSTVAYIDENDNEIVTLTVDLDELASLVGGDA